MLMRRFYSLSLEHYDHKTSFKAYLCYPFVLTFFAQIISQRPFKELSEVYSTKHFPESDVFKDNVRKCSCFTSVCRVVFFINLKTRYNFYIYSVIPSNVIVISTLFYWRLFITVTKNYYSTVDFRDD